MSDAQASAQIKPHGNRRHPSQAARQKAYRERQRELAEIGKRLADHLEQLEHPTEELICYQVKCYLTRARHDPEHMERLRANLREALADWLDIL